MQRRFVRRDIRSKIPKKENFVRIPAIMGDGNGNIRVAGQSGYVYIRFLSGQIWTAFNAAAAPTDSEGYKIWVGTTKNMPLRLQVLGLRDVYGVPGTSWVEIDTGSLVWPEANTLWIRAEQYLPGLAIPVSGSMNVTFLPLKSIVDETIVQVSHQTVNFSSYVPTAGAKWLLVEYDNTGTLNTIEGNLVNAKSLLNVTNIPSPTVGSRRYWALKVYDGQAEFAWNVNYNDLVDLRWAGSVTLDADSTEYLPAEVADWDYLADPGKVAEALDQLAQRTKDLETIPPGSWDGDITDIDETSSTDIGEALADADQLIVFNDSASTWVRSALSRVKTYIQALTDTLYSAVGHNHDADYLAADADYTDISANDADTNINGLELEELSDGSETVLHSHADTPRTGWIPKSETWTRTANTTFTIASDVTADPDYQPGIKIKVTDSASVKYGVILSVSYGAPNSTITLFANDDYVLAAGALSSPSISKIEKPDGWPGWFSRTPTLSASGSMTISASTLVFAQFRVRGRSVTEQIAYSAITLGGTASNGLYINPATNPAHDSTVFVANTADNGGLQEIGIGLLLFVASAYRFRIRRNLGANFTIAAGAQAYVNCEYEF
jgi:hypothetical protein